MATSQQQPNPVPKRTRSDSDRMAAAPASIRIGGEVLRNGKWVKDSKYDDLCAELFGQPKETPA